jgi:phosphate:Na+ symporter
VGQNGILNSFHCLQQKIVFPSEAIFVLLSRNTGLSETASMMPANTIEFGALLAGLAGGLALFLLGMRQLSDSLKVVAGNSMKNLLKRLTANRFTGALAGMIITAVIQSSSVTTVLIVGFISAGLLTLSQSIGVIIGANIGTTITAQIIAFKITKYGLLAIAVGFFIDAIGRSEKVKHWGMMLMGLGLIFFGMELMSSATVPLREWPTFIEAMRSMDNPLLNILIGTIFTAVIQSSSASTGIVIVLASQSLVTLESAIGLVFGANIGTCITAIIAAFGRPREAVQAAWVHVIFNLAGVLIWMFFIPQFASFIRSISYVTGSQVGSARIASEIPRQIANAHTLFNVGNALLFIWFTGPLAKLVEWVVPKRDPSFEFGPKFLDELFLEHASMALDQVRLELVRLAEIVQEMLDSVLEAVTSGTQEDIARIRQAESQVNSLHGSIVAYLAKLSQRNLIERQSIELHRCINIANYLENIGDIVENNLLTGAAKRMKLEVEVSPSTTQQLKTIHEKVFWAFDRTLRALSAGDKVAAQDAVQSKSAINELAERATSHLAARLVVAEPNRIAAFSVETDVIENLKRINTLTRRIARLILDEDSHDTVASEPNGEGAVV